MVNILIGTSGSVATIKTIEITKILKELGHNIQIVSTKASLHFLKIEEYQEIDIKIYKDEDEWNSYQKRGDNVLHIEVLLLLFNIVKEMG
jgi:phosphopantothenoylcysteine decarboxylase